jgi:enolase
MKPAIEAIKAREILSTSARPTIETLVELNNGVVGVASVPFGTSAGTYEAVTLIDGDASRYRGRGMLKAIENVHSTIGAELVGLDAIDQKALDEHLISLDPTPQRKTLGGNAILSVSLACARAAAAAKGVPLYKHIREAYGISGDMVLPKPMVVLIEGGCHADNSTDLQEYLVGVTRDMKARENVRAAVEVYFALGDILKAKGYSINVGLEGAYAPTAMASNEEPLQHITKAISDAGYEPGEDLGIAMDPAASEFHKGGLYHLGRDNKQLTSDEMIAYYEDLVARYPIFSIEDGLGEDDWGTWPRMNERLGDKIIIMGDDLTVTRVERLQRAIDTNSMNAILIKPNQVGTLTETIAAMELARKHGLKTVVSHRGGGETTDTFIIDIAAAAGADFVKVGITRGERVVKYNRLMEIGDELGL